MQKDKLKMAPKTPQSLPKGARMSIEIHKDAQVMSQVFIEMHKNDLNTLQRHPKNTQRCPKGVLKTTQSIDAPNMTPRCQNFNRDAQRRPSDVPSFHIDAQRGTKDALRHPKNAPKMP